MSRNIYIMLFLFLVGMVGGIFSTEILWPYLVERPLSEKYGLDSSPVYITEKKDVYIQENTALQELIEKTEKSVVGIKGYNIYGTPFSGSGFVLTSDGLVITLSELIPYGLYPVLYIEEEEQKYQVLKRDLANNLVLLKLEKTNLSALSFSDLDNLKLGQRVFLSGKVFDGLIPQAIVNEGIVKMFDEDYIKTNMFEKKTLEGSPLFNISGEVLGINIIDTEGKVISIPISKIKEFAGF